MIVKIIGIRTYETKDGKIVSVIFFGSDFEDWEQEGAIRCDGNKVDSEYLGTYDISNLKVGDVVKLSYNKGFQGKARLTDISLVNENKSK